MVKSKLCLDIKKMGDPDRAHRCFNKNLILIKFYIFMHRHPAPSEVENILSYYYCRDASPFVRPVILPRIKRNALDGGGARAHPAG